MISLREWLGTTIGAAAALAFYHVRIAGERLVSPPGVVAGQITLEGREGRRVRVNTGDILLTR